MSIVDRAGEAVHVSVVLAQNDPEVVTTLADALGGTELAGGKPLPCASKQSPRCAAQDCCRWPAILTHFSGEQPDVA
jgi:hypothetical protein